MKQLLNLFTVCP